MMICWIQFQNGGLRHRLCRVLKPLKLQAIQLNDIMTSALILGKVRTRNLQSKPGDLLHVHLILM